MSAAAGSGPVPRRSAGPEPAGLEPASLRPASPRTSGPRTLRPAGHGTVRSRLTPSPRRKHFAVVTARFSLSIGGSHGTGTHPRGQVQLRALDGRLAGPRPVRRGHPAGAGRRRGGAQARRARRVRHHLPRRRPDPAGQQQRRAGPDHRRVQAGARRHRHGGADGDHQPVRRPGLQGRRLHQQRPVGAPLRAAQGDAQHGPGRRAGRADLRLLGRPRGLGGRLRQGRPGRAGPLPRGHRPARPVLDRQGLRHALRHRAQAERAARRHPAAHASGTRWRSSPSSSTPTWSASTPRPATSRWPA